METVKSMEPVHEIYEITKELKQMLEQLPPDENREEYIYKMDNLIDQRGRLIESIPKTLSKEQVEMIKKTVDLYGDVDKSMNKFFQVIENDLVKIGQKKKLHNKYTQKPILIDGMFVDKRK